MKFFVKALCLAALTVTSGLTASRLIEIGLRDIKPIISLSEHGYRNLCLEPCPSQKKRVKFFTDRTHFPGSLKAYSLSSAPYIQKRFYCSRPYSSFCENGDEDRGFGGGHLIKNLQDPQFLVEVLPYNKDWPRLFEEEASKVRQILGQECIAIYHIGSTSVPSLAAKPVIDIMPVVKDIFQVGKYRTAMEAQGYEARGMCHFTFGYVFKRDAPHPACYVHVFGEGNSEIDFHLKFRDYLRTHDRERDAYAALKVNLAQTHSRDIVSYCLGKSAFFKRIYTKMRWEEEAAREIAKRMIRKGMPVEEICEITDLNLGVVSMLTEEIASGGGTEQE
jgi:GrpB-like predicted nucleotidyltransferase (UPF0157 family)